MTTTQDNIASPFIQQQAQSIFGTQQQYIQDLLKIKRLMNKSKLGILSEQLFIILKQKYPQEYCYLLLEQHGQEGIVFEKDEKNQDEKRHSEPTPLSKSNIPQQQEAQKEKELKIFEYWINQYGRP